MGWPPSPVHMLNQKFRFVGIHFDSVRLEIALVSRKLTPRSNKRPAIAATRPARSGQRIEICAVLCMPDGPNCLLESDPTSKRHSGVPLLDFAAALAA